MTVRVQCLSGAVRSMLKVAVCLVVAAVTVMALSGLAGTTADAVPDHPETSCQPDTPGNDPCAGATGPIGENSCNGDDACADSSGQIGDGSCIGDDACTDSSSSISNGSCNGLAACYESSSDMVMVHATATTPVPIRPADRCRFMQRHYACQVRAR